MNIKNLFSSHLMKNLFSLTVVKGLDYIVPLLLVPFLFRTLGVEMFGLVYFAQAFIGYFSTFTAFGFNYYTTHYISVNINDKPKVNEAFGSVIAVKTILAIISFVAMIIIINTFSTFQANQWVYIFYFGVVIGEALIPSWYFQAIEKMKFITYIAIVSRFLTVIPIFLFVRSPVDVCIPPLCYSLGSILSGVIGILLVVFKFKVSLSKISLKAMLMHLKGSSIFAFSAFCTSVQAYTGAFILGLVGGPTATGIYSAAQKLTSVYISLIQPIQMVMYPYMIKSRNFKLFAKILLSATTINFVGVTIVIFLTPYIIEVFYNSTSADIVNVMRIIMLKTYGSIPVILIGFPLLGVIRSNALVIRTTIIASLFYIGAILIMYFCNIVDIYSIAILAVATEYVILFQRIYLLRDPIQKYLTNFSNKFKKSDSIAQ